MSDLKEFIELLGERKTHTKELVRQLAKHEIIPDTFVPIEILTNQITMLNVAQVLLSMADKIERRLDAFEEWHQGQLRELPGKPEEKR